MSSDQSIQKDESSESQSRNQLIQQSNNLSTNQSHQFSDCSLEQLRQRQEQFCADRDWHQFHTPRNLLLALVGEVGELSEIFQWKGEVGVGLPEFSEAERTHVGEEMADCLLYLIRMADRCNIDLSAAVLNKIEKNARKYPADQAKGRSDKYHAYQQAKHASQRNK